MSQTKMKIHVKGTVRGFQVDNRTGLIVPGTEFEGENTIQNGLKYYLAYKIGTDTIDQSMSNRFATSGTLSATDDNYDGIAYGTSSTELENRFDTDINAGGDNSLTYIEFSGSIAGPLTMAGQLWLGWKYVHASTGFTKNYSYYTISQTVDSGNTFYFYWRITLS